MSISIRLGAAVLVGAGAIAGVATLLWEGGRPHDAAPSSASAAPVVCGPLIVNPVESSNHIDDEPIDYPAGPPAAGDHRSRWAYFARNFYAVADRPEVAELVHNLEHGYSILWYDESIADDPALLREVGTLSKSYDGAKRDPDTALIAAPWTAADGPAFPPNMTVALTHWYADPKDNTRSRADERALTKYCTGLAPETVAAWMRTYPLSDSPEGAPGNM